MGNIDIKNFATAKKPGHIIPTCKECGRHVRPGWGIQCSVCGKEPICRRHGSGLVSIPYVCQSCKEKQQNFLNTQQNSHLLAAEALLGKIALAENMFASKENTDLIIQEIIDNLEL